MQLAEVYVDFKREAGKVSKGPTFNYKKLVSFEWSGYCLLSLRGR